MIEKYKNESEDHYDFWNEHIKYVVFEALSLADEFGADKEIVELGALLHDIALITKVGERKDHHINGEILAKEILMRHGYDAGKMAKVLACVRNHRSSKNASSNATIQPITALSVEPVLENTAGKVIAVRTA